MDTRPLLGIRLRGAWFVGSFALGLAAACSSSSPSPASSSNPPGDSGTPEAAPFSPVADAGGTPMGMINAKCGALAMVPDGASSACPSGQTCCTTISIGSFSVTAACMAKEQCSGGVSNECTTSVDCAGGVCCAGSAATDASTEAGAGGGFGGGLNFAAFNTTCQTRCQPGQQQQCASDAECSSGEVCQAASLAGIAGDAGAGGTGGFGGFGGGTFMLPKTCRVPTPDSGAPPEAGSPPATDASADSSDQ